MSQRSLRIETAPGTALLQLAWNGGGELPAALSGLFTSAPEAQRVIDAWSAEHREVVVIDNTRETAEETEQKRGPGRPRKEPIPI